MAKATVLYACTSCGGEGITYTPGCCAGANFGHSHVCEACNGRGRWYPELPDKKITSDEQGRATQ